MLSPRYLEGMSDEIVDIYAQLEADILQDMARRIARLGKVTESTTWQAQLLAETGALKKDVSRILKKYDPAIRKEITAIYNDAMIKNARADNKIFSEALGHGVSDINAQVMLASIQKTRSDLSRLTITTAYTTEQQFVQVANAAYMQVISGAFDYDTAMKKACNQLAADGVSGVQYRNGRPVRLNIEPAVRMNIITGVNQTASQMTLNNCDELGCDLVETTAHIGARPEHAAWQGEVFSISGNNPKYRPFSVCELGTITGLCGINCRHSYYPYFEGTEKHYTQSDLDEMEKQTVTYNGKTMTRYEGEEQLRGIERNIRHYKRRALTQEAAGIDSTAAREKIGEWQARAREFTKQTGIERDRAREFIGTVDGKQPRGIVPTDIKASNVKETPQKVTAKVLERTQELKAALVDNPESLARQTAEWEKIPARTVYAHAKDLTEKEIIKYIAGADRTSGSCSSVANAYIANKAGFDVRDFRGGKSLDLFSRKDTSIQMAGFKGVVSKVVRNTNDYMAFEDLRPFIKKGKEYKLGIGQHAAIVRKTADGALEYLEMQSAGQNTFKPLTHDVLRCRFGCRLTHSSYGMAVECPAYLIEVESLGKSREFIELMKYLNTAENMQRKGSGGWAK